MKYKHIFVIALSLISSQSMAGIQQVEAFEIALPKELKCFNNDEQPACIHSSEMRDDDLFIYIRSNKFQKKTFEHEAYIRSLLIEANEIYSSFNKRTLKFNQPDSSSLCFYYDFGGGFESKIVAVIDFKFKGRSLTAIHDNNDTIYVDYEDRIDFGNLLKVHRKIYVDNKRHYFNPDKANDYFISGRNTTKTSTYDVFSAPAVKNIKTGEVTETGPKEETNRQTRYTRTISYQASYFNLDD
jgi:hypothetical protein